MLTDFARDLADADKPIRQALATRPGKPIKIRVQPMVLIGTQYRAWKDVRWTLECDSADEAFAVREAMRTFFRVMGQDGPEVVGQLLALATAAKKAAPTKAGAA